MVKSQYNQEDGCDDSHFKSADARVRQETNESKKQTNDVKMMQTVMKITTVIKIFLHLK